MDIRRKLPFYLGLGVFIISVLFVSVKLGEKNFVVNSPSRAAAGTSLFMDLAEKNLVTVSMISDKPVGGVDAVLKFDPDKVEILSSTLKGGEGFIATGGTVDGQKGLFAFSVLPAGSTLTRGVVAAFEIRPKNKDLSATAIHFVEGEGNTAVLENATMQPMGIRTESLKIK